MRAVCEELQPDVRRHKYCLHIPYFHKRYQPGERLYTNNDIFTTYQLRGSLCVTQSLYADAFINILLACLGKAIMT